LTTGADGFRYRRAGPCIQLELPRRAAWRSYGRRT
jgi:hypothetical protein